jgi:hypothetical protein
MRLWQQVVKADPTAYADFLAWAEAERQRVVEEGFNVATWEGLIGYRGQQILLDLVVASFTLPDIEESHRAEYRRRNA